MKRVAGFTLIELLVVIAIIAILAAILFPVFMQAREKGRQAACASNLKQIGMAWMRYMDDYGSRVPGYCDAVAKAWSNPDLVETQGGQLILGSPLNRRNSQKFLLSPYVKSTKVKFCPTPSAYTYWNGQMLQLPQGGVYGYNVWSLVFREYNYLNWERYQVQYASVGVNFSEIKRPTRIICFMDYWAPAICNITTTGYWFNSPRHSGGYNALMCDGHLKWFDEKGDLNTSVYYDLDGDGKYNGGTTPY